MALSNALTLARRELGSYFSSLVGYVYIVAFTGALSWLFFRSFFLIGTADMREFFSLLPLAFVVLVPAVTMRSWAEERKLGTMEVLLTLPVSDVEAVAGKFLGALLFLAVVLALTFPVPWAVSQVGEPDTGAILGGYLGALLLGAALVAAGLFTSSLTDNQIVAFVLAFGLGVALLLAGHPLILYTVPRALAPALEAVAVLPHYEALGRGVVDTRDVAYFASQAALFLALNVVVLDSRRWR